jgi:hypothetical protein
MFDQDKCSPLDALLTCYYDVRKERLPHQFFSIVVNTAIRRKKTVIFRAWIIIDCLLMEREIRRLLYLLTENRNLVFDFIFF